jgi:hypothetical protein
VLAQTLNASEPALRFQALLASARLSISDLPARLQSALSDVDPPLRYLALRLIDEHWERCLSRTTLLQQAAQALQDSDRQVRVGAALLPWETLPGAEGRGGHAPAAEVRTRVEQVLLEAIEARIALPAPEDEQALIERVAHLQLVGAISGLRRIAWGRFGLPSGALAYQARVALLSLGDETAVQHFKKALGSRRTAICAQAVVAVTEARAAALGPEIEALARRGDVDSELIESARTALAQHSAR